MKKTENETNATAEYIMKKLGVNTYREFYCKVAWKLPEATINNNLEQALNKGNDPARYFTWLCKKAGV